MATTAAAASMAYDGYQTPKERENRLRRRLETVKTRTTTRAADEFFAASSASSATEEDWRTLPRRLSRLCQVLEGWTAGDDGTTANADDAFELPYRFSQDPKEARRIALTASIMASAPPSFYGAFESLFRACIRLRDNDGEDDNIDMDESLPSIPDFDPARFVRDLRTLGWIRAKGGLVRKPFLRAISKSLLHKVRETVAGDYETPGLYARVQNWRNAVVMPWLVEVLSGGSSGDGIEEAGVANEDWSSRLEQMTAECYCVVRMDELFDMVADYPDSHVAVLELRQVLTERTSSQSHQQNLQTQVAHVLRSSLIRRLNHPGANTSQIIDVYIATIKVLRVLDPSDRLLGLVAEPVRSYLRSRSDTVRCIITSLTDAEVGGDLYQELRRQDAKPLENVTIDSDDEEECPTFDWQPPPSIHKQHSGGMVSLEGGGHHSGSGTTGGGTTGSGDGDILAMLVSIYGSKELFVDEYRLMLADKLLANLDYNTDKEVHTLELLKLRFGEMSMRNCEVMIKDMDDSKRTNHNIHSTLESSTTRQAAAATGRTDIKPVTDVAMISHIFWPTLQNDTLKHHPRIQAELDEFGAEYARLKNPRKLVWLDQLGTVQLELDVVEDGPDGVPIVGTKEFSCTPLLASLISHFEDKAQWSLEDLSNETGIAEHILQKKMVYWVNNRVVKVVGHAPGSSGSSTSPLYEIATPSHLHEGGGLDGVDNISMMDDDGSDQAVSVSAQEEEEIQVYESYIMGMLTNLQQLPLERIHNMLKMFCGGQSDIKYNKTPQQLSSFLQHLCKAEKLECGPDGMYKLFKK